MAWEKRRRKEPITTESGNVAFRRGEGFQPKEGGEPHLSPSADRPRTGRQRVLRTEEKKR